MLRLIIILILICFAIRVVMADEISDKCQALRVLNEQYRGKQLSISERAIKVQMVAWYRVNCKKPNRKGSI